MTIVRYENITVNNVTNGVDSIGQYTQTITEWFKTRALTHDVANSVRISERYRVYSDVVTFTVNYTPNTKLMVDRQEDYSITWRNHDWRIVDVRETNDRQRVIFYCYRNDPDTRV